jgi:hypothetical protein
MPCLKKDWLKSNFEFIHSWFCKVHGYGTHPVAESDHWVKRDIKLDSILEGMEIQLSLPKGKLRRSKDIQIDNEGNLPRELYKYRIDELAGGTYHDDEPYDKTLQIIQAFVANLDHDLCDQAEYEQFFYLLYRLIECHAVLRCIYAREVPIPEFNQISNQREAGIALNIAAYFFARGQMTLNRFREVLQIYDHFH